MGRIQISSDGECILIRQGNTVVVVTPDQAESIAATIVLESERIANRQNKDEQRRMQAFDAAVRGFHAVYVPEAGGLLRNVDHYNDDADRTSQQFSDADRAMLREVTRRRMRDMGLDGVDAG